MAMATGGTPDKTLGELVAIKKLLILGLLRSGAAQSQVAAALGVDQSQISRLFPGGVGRATKTAKKSAK